MPGEKGRKLSHYASEERGKHNTGEDAESLVLTPEFIWAMRTHTLACERLGWKQRILRSVLVSWFLSSTQVKWRVGKERSLNLLETVWPRTSVCAFGVLLNSRQLARTAGVNSTGFDGRCAIHPSTDANSRYGLRVRFNHSDSAYVHYIIINMTALYCDILSSGWGSQCALQSGSYMLLQV